LSLFDAVCVVAVGLTALVINVRCELRNSAGLPLGGRLPPQYAGYEEDYALREVIRNYLRAAAGWPRLLVNPGGAAARGQGTTGPWTSRRSTTPVARNRGHPRRMWGPR
jgi:hypothetical protein